MARFYFHLWNGGDFTGDPEGEDLPDMEAARSRAISAARDVMAHEMKGGKLNLSSYIEVENSGGEPLFKLHFEEAFVVTRHGDELGTSRQVRRLPPD